MDKKALSCAKCHADTKRLRRCEEDRWDFGKLDGSSFPIKMRDEQDGYGFCPAKVIRDSPGTTVICQGLYVQWKAGKVEYDNLTFEEVNRLYLFIRRWEGFEKARDYHFLSRLLVGDKKK